MKIKNIFIAAALVLFLTLPCLAAETGDNMKLAYLSDMEWKSASIYSGAYGGITSQILYSLTNSYTNENVAGEEIWLYESYFEKGVGFHADAGKLAYIEVDISRLGYKTFLTYVGTAESELYDVSMASVRFTFKLDGEVKQKTGVIRPDKPPEMISLDVSGGKILRIEMDDGGDSISGDWGSLGYAVFSDSADTDMIIKTLTKKEEQTTAETETETEEETGTEKITETEESTEAPTETEPETTDSDLPEKKSEFPVIPVIIGAAAVVCAATVIAIIIKRRKK